MKIWILTIGSSDVQLKSDKANQEAGRSSQQFSGRVWTRWFSSIKPDCYGISFAMSSNDVDESYRVPARVLGMVYRKQPDLQEDIFSYLTFPLLGDFTQKARQSGEPSQIVLVLTDQSEIFADSRVERGLRSPYWQDTYELLPILKRYFSEQLPNAQVVEPIVLQPETAANSLDNWDSVLELVRQKFAVLNNDLLATDDELEQVYVSHQASTPAISSAVQFMALSYFGDRVRFLVTSENQNNLKTSDSQEDSAKFIESSNYLRGIKKQQAIELLKFGNYAAVKGLLNFELSQDLSLLLEAAIQWNFAEFDKFFDAVSRISNCYDLADLAIQRKQLWWATAYESAYLAVKRLDRVDTVEAMFHSFRAVEGLLKRWFQKKPFKRNPDKRKEIILPREVYWQRSNGEFEKVNSVLPYGQGLYFALDSVREVCESKDEDIWNFGNFVFNSRNDLFHQLNGLQNKQAIFEAWKIDLDVSDPESLWKKRILNCLNFISGQTFKSIDQVDNENDVASLMILVHQRLVDEVNKL